VTPEHALTEHASWILIQPEVTSGRSHVRAIWESATGWVIGEVKGGRAGG
jgi:hypothetical protein